MRDMVDSIMRIYSHLEFLKLPAGTVYCAGRRWTFGELCIKGQTVCEESDFLSLALQWIESPSFADDIDRLERMLAEKASEPLQESFGRDGMFDNDAIYLVYEVADLARMIRHFSDAIVTALKASR